MKNYWFLIGLMFVFGCQQSKKIDNKNPTVSTAKDSLLAAQTDTIALGDLNNDKIADTAFIYTPPTMASFDAKGKIQYQFGCLDNHCFNRIAFSCKLPEITSENSVWGRIENAGDLNNDGISELLFVPGWFTSSMAHLFLYSLQNGKWETVAKVDYRNNDGPLLPNLIQSDGKYYLRGVDFSDDDAPYQTEIHFKK
ncbi:hypothetical protein [Flavobacterium sp.]|uniref:hypothetical protein n=1 Tax=Flavobacterium sp. TaxID=239 RepID=UPI0039E339A2